MLSWICNCETWTINVFDELKIIDWICHVDRLEERNQQQYFCWYAVINNEFWMCPMNIKLGQAVSLDIFLSDAGALYSYIS
jgi:hypothetical protein